MDNVLIELQNKFGENRIRVNESMETHTAFKAQGLAPYYLDVNTTDELIAAAEIARNHGLPFHIIGSGTQLIVAQQGLPGIAVKNNCRKFEIMGVSGRITNQQLGVDKAMVFAESGVIVNQLVRFTIEQGLQGLEYHLGLPGTVGGGLYRNSGLPSKKVFIGDMVYKAKILSSDGTIKDVDHTYFQFGYDNSYLRQSKDIVLSVVYRLEKEDSKVLWQSATEALQYRTETQPKDLCAGYTYRNIGIDNAHVAIPDRNTFASRAIKRVKMSGKKVGNVMFSATQPNYIMNIEHATSENVQELITKVKDSVFEQLGLQLYVEV